MFAPTSVAGASPFNDWFVPDTTQRNALGMIVDATDPFWGTGRFIYVKSNDAILKGSVCTWSGIESIALGVVTGYKAVLCPTTTLTGFPVGVAMYPIPSGSFGWLQIQGTAVYKTSATVALDAVIAISGAAGILAGTAISKQLQNVHNSIGATSTMTVKANTTNGSGVITCGDYAGFFIGMALTSSPNNLAASTVVAAMSPDGRTIFTGSAIGTLGDKNCTASGPVTLTGTFTGFGAGFINHPMVQGAIT